MLFAALILSSILLFTVFFAVTKTHVLTYLVLRLLKLKLIKSSYSKLHASNGSSVSPRFEKIPGGFEISGLLVDEWDLGTLNGPFKIKCCGFNALSWTWPTLKHPAQLKIVGLQCELLQRKMPEASSHMKPWNEKESDKLNILEALLWTGPRPKRTLSGSLQWITQRLAYMLSSLLIQKLTLEVLDSCVLYIQDGEPGPRAGLQDFATLQSGQRCRSDAMRLDIRLLRVAEAVQHPGSTASMEQRELAAGVHNPAPPGRGDQEVLNEALHREWNDSVIHILSSIRPAQMLSRRVQISQSLLSVLNRGRAGWRQPREAACLSSPQDPQVGGGAVGPGLMQRFGILLRPLYLHLKKALQGGGTVRGYVSSRLTVAGVSVSLLTGDPDSGWLKPNKTRAQKQKKMASTWQGTAVGGLTQSAVPHLETLQTPMGFNLNSRADHETSASNSGASPIQTTLMQGDGRWDACHVLLKQWGLEAVIRCGTQNHLSLNPRAAHAGSTPAVLLSLTFGLKSKSAAPAASSGVKNGDNTASASAVQPDQQGMPGVSISPPPPKINASTLCVDLSIVLKALVPELNPDAALIAMRIADRFITFSKYEQYWARRPSAPISNSPAAWWQHAGHSIVTTCRSRYPVRQLRHLLEMRHRYISVYTELMRRSHHLFQEGGRAGRLKGSSTESQKHFKWWLNRETKASLETQLRLLECKLTLAQVVTFRLCVALKHSRYLNSIDHDASIGDWKSFVDVMNIFVDAHPHLEDDDESDGAHMHPDALHVQDVTSRKSVMSITVSCPRLGLILIPPQTPQSQQFCGFAPASSTPGQSNPNSDHSSAQPLQGSVDPSQPPAVIEILVKGLEVRSPTAHHVIIQASSIKAGEVNSKSSPLLRIPASLKHLQATDPKYNSCDPENVKVASSPTPLPPVAASVSNNGNGSVIDSSVPGAVPVAASVSNNGNGSVIDSSVPGAVPVEPQKGPYKDATNASGAFMNSAASSERPGQEHRGWEERYPMPSFVSSSDTNLLRGSLYPDAPISEYLPRVKVTIAPVEVNLGQGVSISAMSFLQAFASALSKTHSLAAAAAASQGHGSSATAQAAQAARLDHDIRLLSQKDSSINALIIDSYVRNGIKVPSALSQLLPKMQAVCPRIVLRASVPENDHTTLGPYFTSLRLIHLVVNISNFRSVVRYTASVYGELAQNSYTRMDVESVLEVRKASLKEGNLINGPKSVVFPKVWLHPADVDLFCDGLSHLPPPSSSPLTTRDKAYRASMPPAGTLPPLNAMNSSSRATLQQLKAGLAKGAPPAASLQFNRPGRSSENGPNRKGTTPSGVVMRVRRLQPSHAFAPLLMIKGLTCASQIRVPCEPTVPDQKVAHHTISMFGAQAWLRPWNIDTLLAVVESFSNNPILRAGHVDLCPSRAPASNTAASSGSESTLSPGLMDPELWRKQREQQKELAKVQRVASAAAHKGSLPPSTSKIGSSKISLLIDVPLFSAHLYWWADPKNALQDHSASPMYGRILLPPRWTRHSTQAGADVDDSARRLIPLATFNWIDVKLGAKLTHSTSEFKLTAAAVHSENHQLRIQNLRVWDSNSSLCKPILGRMKDKDTISPYLYVLSSNHTRTSAADRFACARRRIMMGLDLNLEPNKRDKRFMCQQLWRRTLELQVMMRASDFAFFLLTGLDKPAYQSSSLAGNPFQSYMALFKKASEPSLSKESVRKTSFDKALPEDPEQQSSAKIDNAVPFLGLYRPLSLGGYPASNGSSHRRSSTMAKMIMDVREAGENTALLLNAARAEQLEKERSQALPSPITNFAVSASPSENGSLGAAMHHEPTLSSLGTSTSIAITQEMVPPIESVTSTRPAQSLPAVHFPLRSSRNGRHTADEVAAGASASWRIPEHSVPYIRGMPPSPFNTETAAAVFGEQDLSKSQGSDDLTGTSDNLLQKSFHNSLSRDSYSVEGDMPVSSPIADLRSGKKDRQRSQHAKLGSHWQRPDLSFLEAISTMYHVRFQGFRYSFSPLRFEEPNSKLTFFHQKMELRAPSSTAPETSSVNQNKSPVMRLHYQNTCLNLTVGTYAVVWKLLMGKSALDAMSARLQRIQANLERLRSPAVLSGSNSVVVPQQPLTIDEDEDAAVPTAATKRTLPDIELSLDIPSLCIKVMVEETAGLKRSGATQVASLVALGIKGRLHRYQGDVNGIQVNLGVGDLRLHDLQGAVEHRNVLSGAPLAPLPLHQTLTGQESLESVQSTPFARLSVQPVRPNRCKCSLKLLVLISEDLMVPTILGLTMSNAQLLITRRFVANIVYAISKIVNAEDLREQFLPSGRALSKASAMTFLNHSHLDSRPAAKSPPPKMSCAIPAPIIIFQLKNVKVLLPSSTIANGSSDSSVTVTYGGAIKRAVDSRALSVLLPEVQLCLPGSWRDFGTQATAVMQSTRVEELFSAGAYTLEEWLVDPEAVALLLCTANKLYHNHLPSDHGIKSGSTPKSGQKSNAGTSTKGQVHSQASTTANQGSTAIPASEAAGSESHDDNNVSFSTDGSQAWEKLKAAAEKLVVRPWTELVQEARRQVQTTRDMEPGMIFMPCDSQEELPGHRPMLYGITPNEDLVMFKETINLSPAPRQQRQNPLQYAAAAAAAATAKVSKKQVSWAPDRKAQEPAGQPLASARHTEVRRSAEAVDACAQPQHQQRQAVHGISSSYEIKGEGWSSTEAASATEDLNTRHWVAVAETDHLLPILVFTVRDLSAGSCTLEPGKAPPGVTSAEAMQDRHRLLKVLSCVQEKEYLPIIFPTDMDGSVFTQGPEKAIHAHLNLGNGDDLLEEDGVADNLAFNNGLPLYKKERMHVLLGPQQYDHLISACTDNLVEHSNVFELFKDRQQALRAKESHKWKTDMANSLSFGPAPQDSPWFLLTAKWTLLKATLENKETWWDPASLSAETRKLSSTMFSQYCGAAGRCFNRADGTSSSGKQVLPFLDADFRTASLSLLMMKENYDLHLSFHSKEAKLRDVRPLISKSALAQIMSVPIAPEATLSRSEDPFLSGFNQLRAKEQAMSVSSSLQQWNGSLVSRAPFSFREESGHFSEGSYEPHQGADLKRGSNESAGIQELDDAHELANEDMASCIPFPKVVEESIGDNGSPQGPVVCILHSRRDLPGDESLHLQSLGQVPFTTEWTPSFKVLFSMLSDGTMANEVVLCNTLLQWPYLTDMSLISAAASIFVPSWCQGSSKLIDTLLTHEMPWFYFNLVINESQIYLPLISPLINQDVKAAASAAHATVDSVRRRKTGRPPSVVSLSSASNQGLRPGATQHIDGGYGGSRTYNGGSVAEGISSLRGRGPLATRTATSTATRTGSFMPTEEPSGNGGGETRETSNEDILWCWPALREVLLRSCPGQLGEVLSTEHGYHPLEETGLALTFGAFRFGYFYGGDGKSETLCDLKNAAGFVRDMGATIANVLLPVKSIAFSWTTDSPRVAEGLALKKIILVVNKANFSSKVMRRRKRAGKAKKEEGIMRTRSVAPSTFEDTLSTLSKIDREKTLTPYELLMNDAWRILSDLMKENGLSELEGGLGAYSAAAQESASKLLNRLPSHSVVTFHVDACRFRAAFSNIPFWHALTDDVTLMTRQISTSMFPIPVHYLQHQGVPPTALRPSPPGTPPSRKTAEFDDMVMAGWNFRPYLMEVKVSMHKVGLLLCNDRPWSHGAPDVLQANMESLALNYLVAKKFSRRQAEQSCSLSAVMSVNFLNDYSSRWQRVLEPWRVNMDMSETLDPVLKDITTKSVKISSPNPLNATFHPSLLMAMGDLFAFTNFMFPAKKSVVPALSASGRLMDSALLQAPSLRPLQTFSNSLAAAAASEGALPLPPFIDFKEGAPTKAPPIQEQMQPGTSRVPKRYLIHNLTGSTIYYSDAAVDRSTLVLRKKPHPLPHDCREELQVVPTLKNCELQALDGTLISSYQTGVISIQFKGFWTPLSQVVVDVVGKYSYRMQSSNRGFEVPVIVDIALVGRTKVLRVHSALYARNSTGRNIRLNLHIPSPYLAMQVNLSAGDHRNKEKQSFEIHSLATDEGTFLPVVACLGGVLSLQPAGYLPSQHDVIRLSPSLATMSEQQGYVCCLPIKKDDGPKVKRPLSFAVKVQSTTSSLSDVHSNRTNLESVGNGKFMHASGILEAQINILPTMELTNSLPYDMEGFVMILPKDPAAVSRDSSDGVTLHPVSHDEGYSAARAVNQDDPFLRFSSISQLQARHMSELHAQNPAASARSDPQLFQGGSLPRNASEVLPTPFLTDGTFTSALNPATATTRNTFAVQQKYGKPSFQSGLNGTHTSMSRFKVKELGVLEIDEEPMREHSQASMKPPSLSAGSENVEPYNTHNTLSPDPLAFLAAKWKGLYNQAEDRLDAGAVEGSTAYEDAVVSFQKLARHLGKPKSWAKDLKEVPLDFRSAVKQQMLSAVREELKWAALRENKAFELLFRADSLKDSRADDAKVKWADLKTFMDWLISTMFPFKLAPGANRRFYSNMENTVMISVRIPDLSTQTVRPFPVNISNISLLLQKIDLHSTLFWQNRQRKALLRDLDELPKATKMVTQAAAAVHRKGHPNRASNMDKDSSAMNSPLTVAPSGVSALSMGSHPTASVGLDQATTDKLPSKQLGEEDAISQWNLAHHIKALQRSAAAAGTEAASFKNPQDKDAGPAGFSIFNLLPKVIKLHPEHGPEKVVAKAQQYLELPPNKKFWSRNPEKAVVVKLSVLPEMGGEIQRGHVRTSSLPAVDLNFKATRLSKGYHPVGKSQQGLITTSVAVPAGLTASANTSDKIMRSGMVVKLMIHARPEAISSSSVASTPIRKKRLSFLGFKSFGGSSNSLLSASSAASLVGSLPSGSALHPDVLGISGLNNTSSLSHLTTTSHSRFLTVRIVANSMKSVTPEADHKSIRLLLTVNHSSPPSSVSHAIGSNPLSHSGNNHHWPVLTKPLPSIINEEDEEEGEEQQPFKSESLAVDFKRQESIHRRSISQGLGDIFNKLGLYSKGGRKSPQARRYSMLSGATDSPSRDKLLRESSSTNKRGIGQLSVIVEGSPITEVTPPSSSAPKPGSRHSSGPILSSHGARELIGSSTTSKDSSGSRYGAGTSHSTSVPITSPVMDDTHGPGHVATSHMVEEVTAGSTVSIFLGDLNQGGTRVPNVLPAWSTREISVRPTLGPHGQTQQQGPLVDQQAGHEVLEPSSKWEDVQDLLPSSSPRLPMPPYRGTSEGGAYRRLLPPGGPQGSFAWDSNPAFSSASGTPNGSGAFYTLPQLVSPVGRSVADPPGPAADAQHSFRILEPLGPSLQQPQHYDLTLRQQTPSASNSLLGRTRPTSIEIQPEVHTSTPFVHTEGATDSTLLTMSQLASNVSSPNVARSLASSSAVTMIINDSPHPDLNGSSWMDMSPLEVSSLAHSTHSDSEFPTPAKGSSSVDGRHDPKSELQTQSREQQREEGFIGSSRWLPVLSPAVRPRSPGSAKISFAGFLAKTDAPEGIPDRLQTSLVSSGSAGMLNSPVLPASSSGVMQSPFLSNGPRGPHGISLTDFAFDLTPDPQRTGSSFRLSGGGGRPGVGGLRSELAQRSSSLFFFPQGYPNDLLGMDRGSHPSSHPIISMNGSPLRTMRRGGSLDGSGALLLLQQQLEQQQLEAEQEGGGVMGGGILQEFASHTLRHAKEMLADSGAEIAHIGTRVVDGTKAITNTVAGSAFEAASKIVDTGKNITSEIVGGTDKVVQKSRKSVKKGFFNLQLGITSILSKKDRRRKYVIGPRRVDTEDDEYDSIPRTTENKLQSDSCPRIFHLCIHNTMALEADPCCRVSIYAPYWVENRTGMDLVFKDTDVHEMFADFGFLVYNGVRAPGTKDDMDASFPMQPSAGTLRNILSTGIDDSPKKKTNIGGGMIKRESSREQLSRRASGGSAHGTDSGGSVNGGAWGVGVCKPALLNSSNVASFKLDDSLGATDFCSSFKIENVSNRSITLLGEKVEIDDPKVLYCQRVYRFSVEVWPAKTDSVFKLTKIVTVKNHYVICNETGFTIEYQQKGSPDPRLENYGKGARFAGQLQTGHRAGLHWDNDLLPHELVIRPYHPSPSPQNRWHWSGSFALPDGEKYFGIKIRKEDNSEVKIVPVNITVGASGSVLITFKSDQSTPPYMMLNRCRDVTISMRQRAIDQDQEWHDIKVGWDIYYPNPLKQPKPIPFAWDEPDIKEKAIQVIAHFASNAEMARLREVPTASWKASWLPRDAIHDTGWTTIDSHELASRARNGRFMVLLVANRPSIGMQNMTTMPQGPAGTSGYSFHNTSFEKRGQKDQFMYQAGSVPQPNTFRENNKSFAYGYGASSLKPSLASGRSMAQLNDAKGGAVPALTRFSGGYSQKQQHLKTSVSTAGMVSSPTAASAVGGPVRERSSLGTHRGLSYQRSVAVANAVERASAAVAAATQEVYAKKVYVSLYADGPTQVICFSEDMSNLMTGDSQLSLPSLGHRLQMIHKRLKQTDELLGDMIAGAENILTEQFLELMPSQSAMVFPTQTPQATPSQTQPTADPPSASQSLAMVASASQNDVSSPRHRPGFNLGGPQGMEQRDAEKMREMQWGGDLKIGIRSARGLLGLPKGTMLFAKLTVGEEHRITDRAPLNHIYGTCEWFKDLVLRDIASSLELVVEVWAADTFATVEDLSKKSMKAGGSEMKRMRDMRYREEVLDSELAPHTPPPGTAATTFIGMVEVPLMHTMSLWKQKQAAAATAAAASAAATASTGGVGGATSSADTGMPSSGVPTDTEVSEGRTEWYPLRRRAGSQVTRGELEIFLDWSVTKEGKLQQQILLLERILAMKLEQLATLSPIPVDVARQYVLGEDSRGDLAAAAGAEDDNTLSGLTLSSLTEGITAATAATSRGGGSSSGGDVKSGGGGSSSGGDVKSGGGGSSKRKGASGKFLMPKLQLPTHAQMLAMATGGGLQGGTVREREQYKRHLAAAAMETDPAAANSSESIWHRLSVRQVKVEQDFYVNLEVSVLELRNLAPREGVTATVLNILKGTQVSASASRALPRAYIELSVGAQTQGLPVLAASLNPKFPANTQTFKEVPLKSTIRVRVYDHIFSIAGANRRRLMGSVQLPLSSIPGTDPIYMWLPLRRTAREAKAVMQSGYLGGGGPDDTADLMVFVRLRLAKPQARIMRLGLTIDLHSIGLVAKSSVEELFNVTLQHVFTTVLQSRTEYSVIARIQAVQIDNQLLETQRPVVLSPHSIKTLEAGERTKKRRGSSSSDEYFDAAHDAEADAPLITVEVIRSLTGEQETITENAIISWKKFHMDIGKLDLVTDQEFIVVTYDYFKSMPLDTLWQDAAWHEKIIKGQAQTSMSSIQQLGSYRQLHRTFKLPSREPSTGGSPTQRFQGSTEQNIPHSPSWQVHARAPYTSSQQHPRGAGTQGSPARSGSLTSLHWLAEKEQQELSMMRSQSSTWFLLQDFRVSSLNISITLALASSIATQEGRRTGLDATNSSGTVPEEQLKGDLSSMNLQGSNSVLRGLLSRVSGADGFQLVNVTNAPIQLQRLSFDNLFVNRVALVNKLYRHYKSNAMVEARKILGGAGPAVATIVASPLWAAISIFDLGRDVSAGNMGLAVVAPRTLFYITTMFGQVLGVFPRLFASFMGVLPIQRSGWLSDQETLERLARKPQTTIDALYLGSRDLMLGLATGLAGLVLDPYEGSRAPGYWAIVGAVGGIFKALLGLALRPSIGILEGSSKLTLGLALVFMGKRGIQGKLIRRIMAPGAPLQNAGETDQATQTRIRHRQVVEAWQKSLYYVAPALAEDRVVDVMTARASRVVLLTDRHIAYLYAKHHAASVGGGAYYNHNDTTMTSTVTYKVKWIVPNELVDNIRGIEKTYRISIDYRKPISLGKTFSLKLPLRKGMRCSNQEAHQALIFRLNQHIRKELDTTAPPSATLPPGQKQRTAASSVEENECVAAAGTRRETAPAGMAGSSREGATKKRSSISNSNGTQQETRGNRRTSYGLSDDLRIIHS